MSFTFGDASKLNFALPTTATTTTAAMASVAATNTATTTTASTTSAAASPFPLGAGDPGAASKASQPQQTLKFNNFKLPMTGAVAATNTLASTTTTTTAATSTPALPTLGLGAPFSFSSSTSAPGILTSTSTAATTGQTSLATSTTVTNSAAASTSSLNFCQLEEAINKWTLELEEQEKLFMNQASQVNTWDRLLIANGEKIINLNTAVEQVKLEQQQLDQELDFILAQQRELEDLLTPLEKELETNGVSDPEREHTYQLAENLDTQLKQMSEDLKEIVEHINETNRSQDNTDPIVQIGRILNAHMNSLQWIDQNTTLIGSHLDQVAKLHEVHRRENERSFRLTYD